MIDHSITYKKVTFRNLVHIARLKKILSLIDSFRSKNSFLDIGCSNGYITNIITHQLGLKESSGCDHNLVNIKIAKKKYPNIHFYEVDLNNPIEIKGKKFDFITCFETLEHVGNLSIALQNILNYRSPQGRVLISVPIETGFIGISKFLIKMLYNYKLTELDPSLSKITYLLTLINPQQSISKYRKKKVNGYSTHFGFDYKQIEMILNNNNVEFKSSTFLTTKFYII